jgi:DNA repair protein RadD
MLRPYQSTFKNQIYERWGNDKSNVLGVMPTGAGKTVTMADIFRDNYGRPELAFAHREELTGQISLALARAGLAHNIIAPQQTINFIVRRHILKLKRCFYNPQAPLAVAGVDTLVRRLDKLKPYLDKVELFIGDEGHHILDVNKWGKVVRAMPAARGLGLTATPCRADRKSLRNGEGGIYDHLVIGPTMRELIDEGYLCDYRIVAPPSDIDLSRARITGGGDFNASDLHQAAEKSRIVGDVVKAYQQFALGKRSVVFAVDVKLAGEHAAAFNAAGIPCAIITADTSERDTIIDNFETGRIKVIVNVDVLGEGFDCPAIECVQFARPTASYGLFVQQFGRALRILQDKWFGMIIDHVGNVMRHGLPDAARSWSLDDGRPLKPDDEDDIPMRVCLNPECLRMWEGYDRKCPYCGEKPKPQGRDRPELVDGDLTEFDPALLARLRGEADDAMHPNIDNGPWGAGPAAMGAYRKRMTEKVIAQEDLRAAMAIWAGVRTQCYGDDLSTAYQIFYRRFGIDAASAQTLGARLARELAVKLQQSWNDDYNRRPQ